MVNLLESLLGQSKDMETSLVGPLQLLSEYLGLSVSTIRILLGISMVLVFSGVGLAVFGGSWGLLFGVVPIIFGVFLGWLPVWIVFIGIIPVSSILYRSFYGLGGIEGEEEVLETPGAPEVPGIPKVPSSRNKLQRKPPWAK